MRQYNESDYRRLRQLYDDSRNRVSFGNNLEEHQEHKKAPHRQQNWMLDHQFSEKCDQYHHQFLPWLPRLERFLKGRYHAICSRVQKLALALVRWCCCQIQDEACVQFLRTLSFSPSLGPEEPLLQVHLSYSQSAERAWRLHYVIEPEWQQFVRLTSQLVREADLGMFLMSLCSEFGFDVEIKVKGKISDVHENESGKF